MATTGNPIKEAAYAYAARGYRLVELHTSTGGCCSCKKGFNCESKGKHPKPFKWQIETLSSAADIETVWGGDARPANIGIVTGPESGIFVVDVDGERGNETMKAHLDDGLVLPPTYTVKTGSGGWHFYYAYPDFEVGNSASTRVGPGVDTRGKGGFVVAPPSVSDKGPYKVVKDIAVAEAPDWLLDLLRPKERVAPAVEPKQLLDLPEAERQRLQGYTTAAVQNELDRLRALHWDDPATYGGEPWDHTVFEVACNLIQLANAPWSGLDSATAGALVTEFAPTDPGFDDDRVHAKIQSARQKVGDQQATYPPKPADAFWITGDEPAISTGNDTENVSNPVVIDPFDSLVAESDAAGPPPPPPRVEVTAIYETGTPYRRDFDGPRLDPTLIERAKAEALGVRYSSRAAIEVVETLEALGGDIDLADFIKPPASISENEDDDALPAVQDWIRRSLRSGSPELLWAALCAVLSGLDTDAPTIVFKGGAPILELLARTLAPAVGEDGETMLLGPRVSTKEVDGPQIVFEFDDTEAIDLLPYADAIVKHAFSHPGTLVEPDADTHEELAALEDYRAAQLHRTRLGLGSRPRIEGTEHA